MQFHFIQCKAAVDILNEIFIHERQADKAIEYNFKQNKNRGKNDRSFIAETVYDIVRNYRFYAFICNNEKNFWHLLHAYIYIKHKQHLKFEECKNFNSQNYIDKKKEAEHRFEIKHSVPDWLLQLIREELPEKWENEMLAMNEKAALYVRVNTLLTNVYEVLKQFEKENIEAEIVFDNCIKLHQRQNIFTHELYQNGSIEVQDAGSQMIAPFLEVEHGMRVIDACAGAGGKSLHLAALMKNKGKIISLDVFQHKLDILRKRASRAKVNIIETRFIENNKTIKRLENSCDRLLLDVPCSGLGVLKRNPDAKWKLSLQKIHEIKSLQNQLLSFYPKMLRSGGKMVYATCSILPSENEMQVQKFLQENTNYRLLEEKHILPSQTGFDGFYMAKIQKL